MGGDVVARAGFDLPSLGAGRCSPGEDDEALRRGVRGVQDGAGQATPQVGGLLDGCGCRVWVLGGGGRGGSSTGSSVIVWLQAGALFW